MKKILFILVIFFCSTSFSFSQDTIFLRNGTEIHALVGKVKKNSVRYRDFNNLFSDSYILKYDEIDKIKYQNGEELIFIKEVEPIVWEPFLDERVEVKGFNLYWQGERITWDNAETILSDCPPALVKYKAARTHKMVYGIVGLPSAFFLGWDLGSRIWGEGNDTFLIISIVGTVIGLVNGFVSEANYKEAANLYNSNRDKEKPVSLSFGGTSTGIGFRLNF